MNWWQSTRCSALLPIDVAELVGGCSQNVAIATGQLLLEEGEPARSLPARRGHVALEVHEPGRVPLVIDRIGLSDKPSAGPRCPPLQVALRRPCSEPVGAISVDADCLRSKAEADPAFGYLLMKRLAAVEMLDRLQATRIRLLDVYGRDVAH